MAELVDYPSLFSLKGKVAVVTGGSRGLGLSAASAFLQAGCSKVFISSRKAAACDEAVAALNRQPNLQPGAKAISAPADSSTPEGVKKLLEQVKKHTDHVDILLANAGATWGAAFDEHPDSAFSKVMDLNVNSVFTTIREFAPLLGKRASLDDPSRILVTASVAGLGVGMLGSTGTFGYSASKAAAISLSRNLAIDLAPRHMTVNALCPGFFPTKMTKGTMDAAGEDVMAAQNPQGRLGRPEDFAGAVVFLCSRAGAHVNAEALAIDGGGQWARGELMNSSGGDSKL
ncbi:oxidoreductase [Sarocladium strictum]|jgi:NAD(P)-dependent dehydrogenase (short-subunit alcohol dehydrogenase family)